jgi:hypothetical protein
VRAATSSPLTTPLSPQLAAAARASPSARLRHSLTCHTNTPPPCSSESACKAFKGVLTRSGLFVKIRWTRGADKMAACGQLGNVKLRRQICRDNAAAAAAAGAGSDGSPDEVCSPGASPAAPSYANVGAAAAGGWRGGGGWAGVGRRRATVSGRGSAASGWWEKETDIRHSKQAHEHCPREGGHPAPTQRPWWDGERAQRNIKGRVCDEDDGDVEEPRGYAELAADAALAARGLQMLRPPQPAPVRGDYDLSW